MRIHVLALALVAASPLITPQIARAQQQVADVELVEAISTGCIDEPGVTRADGATGRITASELRKALLKRAPLAVTAELMDPSGPTLSVRIATLGTPDGPVSESARKDANFKSAQTYDRLVRDWVDPSVQNTLPLNRGGVVVTLPDGSSPSSDRETRRTVLAAILAADEGPYAFRCRPKSKEGQPRVVVAAPAAKESATAGRWALAKTPKDLAKAVPTELQPSDDKTYAELSFTDDNVKDVETYAINAAFGYVFSEKALGSLWYQGSVFLEAQRQGTDVPVKDGYVNNLNLGAGFSGQFGSMAAPVGYALTAKALSDDDLDSRAYQASLSLTPSLTLPGYDTALYSDPWKTPILGVEVRAWTWWNLSAVADWMQVDDPGEKEKLKTTPRYARLGYDLNGHLLWKPTDPRRKYAVKLDLTYSLRDGQTEHGGDAQLVSAALRYLPEPRYAISLGYDRGENLDTLERIEIWKIIAGVRF